jgi:hypothetical protein
MARFVNQTATILAGQSLSDVVDCSTGRPTFIHMPQEWTASRMTFQVSPDGINFNDLFDNNAVELAFNIVAGTSVLVDPAWAPITHLRLRSGSRALAVPQAANRAIVITLDTAAG